MLVRRIEIVRYKEIRNDLCCCCLECCQHKHPQLFWCIHSNIYASLCGGYRAPCKPSSIFSVFVCQIVSWDPQDSCSGYIVYISLPNNSSNPIHRVLKGLLLISMLSVAFEWAIRLVTCDLSQLSYPLNYTKIHCGVSHLVWLPCRMKIQHIMYRLQHLISKECNNIAFGCLSTFSYLAKATSISTLVSYPW